MKQVTIKEIAVMSGVSAGTVDRVLHARGKVSEENKAKVEAVLKKVNFKFNIHTSAVSLKRKLRITACIPTSGPGDYWSRIHSGFEMALAEFSDIYIDFQYITFNQFDKESCHRMFEALLQTRSDGVIIGPIFEEETVSLCKRLELSSVPYVFVDGNIEGTKPVASFSVNQELAGRLAARLLHSISCQDTEYVLFHATGGQEEVAHNFSERSRGFLRYFEERNLSDKVFTQAMALDSTVVSAKEICEFFKFHPSVKAAAMLNQRGSFIAEALSAAGKQDVKLVSFDITSNNVKCLENGSIDVLLDQSPVQQGFLAVRSLLHHLIYKDNAPELPDSHLNINIVLKENLPDFV